MNFLRSIAILLIFSFYSNVNITVAQGIEFFNGDWEEALELSKTEGKPIFVDAYASWCGPCKEMARTTFKDKEVGDFMNKNFIPMKLDMEKGAGIRFEQKFPVSSYPTLYFIDHNEQVLKKNVGAKSPEKLIKLGKFVLSNIDYSKDNQVLYEEGERGAEFIYDYVVSLNRSNKSNQVIANAYFREKSKIVEEIDLKILFESSNYVDSKLFEKMIELMPAIRKIYPKEEIEEKVTSAASNSVQRAIEFQVESIKDESLAAVKEYAPSHFKEFQVVQNLEYYKALRDKENYKIAAEAFIKFYFKEDKDLVFDLCIDCVQLFDRNADFLDFAEKHLKKLNKKENSIAYLQALSQVYFYKNDKEKALKYANKAKKMAEKESQPTQAINQLIRRIES